MSREVDRGPGGGWPASDARIDAGVYRSLLATLDHGLFRVNADARFEGVDEDFAEITGHPTERLEGAHVATVLAGDGERFVRAIQTGRGLDDGGLEVTLQPADDEPVEASVQLDRIFDDGDLEGALGIVETVEVPDSPGDLEGADTEPGGGSDGAREAVAEAVDGPGDKDDSDGVDEVIERAHESDRYRALTEAARDVIVTMDEDSIIESINPAVEDLFGYEPSELVGESLTTLMPDELAGQHEAAIDHYLRTGERRLDWNYVELEGEDARGERIPLAVSFGEVVHEGESHFTGIIRDITERQTYQRELRQYEKLVEESTDVISVVGPDGTVDYATPSAQRVMGYDSDELEGEDAFELVHPEDRAEVQAEFQALVEDPDYRAHETFRLRRSDGSWAVVQARGRNLLDDPHVEGIVVYTHDITERQEYQRELRQYEKLVEESTDVISIVDAEGTIEYATPSARRVMGYGSGELVGEDAFELIHPEDREEVRDELEAIIRDPDYRAQETFRFRRSDGSWVVVQARARNLLGDPHVGGIVVYTHDITERRRNEKRLEEQRERLAALNQLNEVVRGVTEAVIDRSTRDEIEATTCERLAASDSYEFAWIGELDPRAGGLTTRAEAGGDDSLEVVADPAGDDDGRFAPMEAAIREGELQVVRDVTEDPEFDAWREAAAEHDVRSFAAIPIGHEGTIYGVITVAADRVDAFQNEERTVVEHLGEIVGHAIAATERKQALMSDSVLELEIEIGDLFADVGGVATADASVRIDQVLSVADDEFLVYGVADEAAVEALESLQGEIPHWGEVTVLSEAAEGFRFEIGLSAPPAISAVASLGGSVRSARIEGGDYRLTVQFPQGTDARQVLETVRDHYPGAEVLARRQVTRSEAASERFTRAWLERLTDRQRTALEVAFYSGFFEWPRDSSGEDVADSIDVSPPTFHQHVRAAERKLFAALLEEADPGASDGEPGSMVGSGE